MPRMRDMTVVGVNVIAALCVAAGASLRELWAADADPACIDREPYLQSLSTDAAVVRSNSSIPCTARISFGPKGDVARVVTEAEPACRHEFHIPGLSPHTEWEYRVTHGDREFGVANFTTLPEAETDGDSAIHFAAFGDSGDKRDYEDEPQAAIAARLAATPDPLDFVLHLGDVVTPGTLFENVQQSYFAVYRTLIATTCVYPAFGNDDAWSPAWSEVFTTPARGEGYPRETYYSFDAGNAHFVALNTYEDMVANEEQLAWLREDLAATRKAWKVAFFHVPPYGTGTHGPDTDLYAKRVGEHIVPILEEYGVDIVFTGHNHAYERTHPILAGKAYDGCQYPDFVFPRGIIYVTSGGGGAPTCEQTSAACRHLSARYLPVHHFLDVRITLPQLQVAAIDATGAKIDRFTIRKDRPRPVFMFVRGDANGSGDVSISDAVRILSFLFAREADICYGAADANGDGAIDIADAVYVLGYLFARGNAPPFPFPRCDYVEGSDSRGCH